MDERAQASRCSASAGKTFLRTFLLSLVLLLITLPAASHAQVVTNIRPTTGTPLDLGTKAATSPTSATTTQITGGTRPNNGTNLFHSFDFFTLGTNEVAHFMNDMGKPTTNIFSRVIGGELSNIDGTLRTNNPLDLADPLNFGTAHLWLINPSGVLLGANARLEVGGWVSITTANYLRFQNTTTVFDMASTQDSLAPLSLAPVVAFGFVGPDAASIAVQGSTLQVPEGQTLSLVGGDRTFMTTTGDTVPPGVTMTAGTLSAPSGRIQIASVASAGEVVILTPEQTPTFNANSFASLGQVQLSQRTVLDASDVSGKGGGSVIIRGGRLMIDQSSILANTVDADGANPGIDINVAQDLSLTNGASITVATTGSGHAGDMQLSAGTLSLDGPETAITTQASGSGNGGRIMANGGTMTLTNGAVISSSTSGVMGGGSGGEIQLTATSLNLDGPGTTISTQTSGDIGNGGNLTANLGTLSLSNGAVLKSENFSFGDGLGGVGQGGNVTIQGLQGTGSAADSVTLSSGASISSTTAGPGPGGSLQIAAKTVQLDGAGTTLTTETDGDGNAGNLRLNVGTLALADSAAILSNNNTNFTFGLGQGGNVTVQGLQGAGSAADSVTLSTGAAITTQTIGFERAGDVAITTGSLKLDGSTITTQTFGPGRGGDVRITAGALQLDNLSGISSFTLDLFGFGGVVGGDISLSVGTLTLAGGSLIHSQSTLGGGQGGNVTIQGLQGADSAADSVALSGGSQVLSDSLESGAGGQVSIATKSLTMDEFATINSSTFGTSGGGNIVVGVQQLSLSGGATITSKTISADENAAAGSTVTVQGLGGPGSKADSVTFSGPNSGIITDTFGGARPGDIAVHARTLNLTSGAVVTAGDTFGSKAGNVTVEADSAMISGGSFIQSQAAVSDAGQVTISANALTLDNGSIIAKSLSAGRGGDVVLDVGSLSLLGGAQINSSTLEAGRAGDITMNVGTLTMTNNSSISSSSMGSATGAAGSVTVQRSVTLGGSVTPADAVTLTNSSLRTSADSTGQGGSITVDGTNLTLNNATVSASVNNFGLAPDGPTVGLGNIGLTGSTITMTGGTITAATGGTRNGGKITVTAAQDLNLTDKAAVTASSTGSGSAGNIKLEAGNALLLSSSSVTSDATATTALGGDVKLTASNMVQLVDSTIETSVKGGTETVGGNINIDPQFVVIQGSQILTTATSGTGGTITISGNVVLIDPTSVLDVSSFSGASGQINIQSPVQNISTSLAPLPKNFASAAALLAERCAARAPDAKFSTFVVAGRDGVPLEPGGLLPSPLVAADSSGPVAPTATGAIQDHAGAASVASSSSASFGSRRVALALADDPCGK